MSIRFPLILLFAALTSISAARADVEPGTPAYERALKGRVVGPDNKPVPKARIRCSNIRTPGEGLMEPGTGSTETDAAGRFVLYPDMPPMVFDGPRAFDPENRLQQHGKLVPLNSTYNIEIDVPGDDAFFHYQASHANTDFVTIRLARPEKVRQFRYEAVGGGFLAANQLSQLSLYYRKDDKSGETWMLPERHRAGGHIAPGTYSPQLDRIVYQPITVTDDSPAELIFKLPPPITYTGRIVDGATDKPIAGAFIIGMNGTGQHSLARLTDEQWGKLEAMPKNPPADDPALAPVREMYTFQLITRTDEQGRFELLQKPEHGQSYGLIAFAKDHLPLLQRLYDTKPDANNRATISDIPLFPAARVFLRPAWKPGDDHAGPMSNQPAVSPRWEFDPPAGAGQPAWFAKLKSIDGGRRQFQYDHWLQINERQPVFVPAGGVTLRLRLETPYHDQWSARDPRDVLKLDQGATKDLGDIAFDKSLLVTVRITDDAGNPIEGAPVRRIDDRHVWSVAHNSDAKGEVKFHVRPQSTGQFGIIDLPGFPQPAPANLVLHYQIGDKPEDTRPMTIRLTPEQITALKGVKPGGPV